MVGFKNADFLIIEVLFTNVLAHSFILQISTALK